MKEAGCMQCPRLKRELEQCIQARRNDLITRDFKAEVSTDPDGARFRMAARLCNYLLAEYVPLEMREKIDRLNSWLMEPEVCRRKDDLKAWLLDIGVLMAGVTEEIAGTDDTETTRAAPLPAKES